MAKVGHVSPAVRDISSMFRKLVSLREGKGWVRLLLVIAVASQTNGGSNLSSLDISSSSIGKRPWMVW